MAGELKQPPAHRTLAVELTNDELDLLCSALDSHTYWQLSDESSRDSGYASTGVDDDATAELEQAEALLRRLEEHRRA